MNIHIDVDLHQKIRILITKTTADSKYSHVQRSGVVAFAAEYAIRLTPSRTLKNVS